MSFRFKSLVSSACRLRRKGSPMLVQGFHRWLAPTLRELQIRKERMEPEPVQHRNTFSDWNYDSEIYAFGKRLGEDFDDQLVRQALTERSYIIAEEERQKAVGIEQPSVILLDNAQLAVEGQLIISKYVFRYLRTVLPRLPEEAIVSIHDHLMNDNILAHVSKHIGAEELILCSDFPVEIATLAHVFKAVVAALAQSSGEDRATLFVRDLVLTQLAQRDINELYEIEQPQQVLNRILQLEGRGLAEARLVAEAGRNTVLAAYQVALYSDKQMIGRGCGETVGTAEEMAAQDALKRLFQTTECMRPIPFNLELAASSSKPFANVSIQDWCQANVAHLVENH